MSAEIVPPFYAANNIGREGCYGSSMMENKWPECIPYLFQLSAGMEKAALIELLDRKKNRFAKQWWDCVVASKGEKQGSSNGIALLAHAFQSFSPMRFFFLLLLACG